MKARVTSNPYNLGNGWFNVGQVVEIERETANYYVLVKSSYRINKGKMALTGWAGRYAHSIELEIIEEAPTVEADPVAMNTEILIATTGDDGETADIVGAVAVAMGDLGPVSTVVDPISENVARLYARLPVGVAVREALDLLYPLEFVITAYPLGAQDMIPDNPSPAMAPPAEHRPAWSYQCGQSGEDWHFGRQAWRQEVEEGNTLRGYWEWVEAMIEENEDAADLEVRDALATGAIVVMVARELVDAGIMAALGGWLNTNGLDSNYAVFPGDQTDVIGAISPENAAQLKDEVIAFIDDKSEDNPRAAVSVSDRWNGKPVNPLDWIGALRSVGACYSGVALDLGETLLRNGNELVITWDKAPGEAAEREIRAALLAALDKQYPAASAPVPCLSLVVPEEWSGRPIDRDGLAAWCGRQGGGDFSLALSAVPGVKLAIHWVTGPRPVGGLEAGILADARTWLNEVGTLGDDEADEPAVMPPCRLTLAVPESWNGEDIQRDVVATWCRTMSGQGFTLELFSIPCAAGGVVVSWVSGAVPATLGNELRHELEARAVAFLHAMGNGTASDPCSVRIRVPAMWNDCTVNKPSLAQWVVDTLGPLYPAAAFTLEVDAQDLGIKGDVRVKVRSTAEPSAKVFKGYRATLTGVTTYMVSRLNELYPADV